MTSNMYAYLALEEGEHHMHVHTMGFNCIHSASCIRPPLVIWDKPSTLLDSLGKRLKKCKNIKRELR